MRSSIVDLAKAIVYNKESSAGTKNLKEQSYFDIAHKVSNICRYLSFETQLSNLRD